LQRRVSERARCLYFFFSREQPIASRFRCVATGIQSVVMLSALQRMGNGALALDAFLMLALKLVVSSGLRDDGLNFGKRERFCLPARETPP
jgi:hypothetical protein